MNKEIERPLGQDRRSGGRPRLRFSRGAIAGMAACFAIVAIAGAIALRPRPFHQAPEIVVSTPQTAASTDVPASRPPSGTASPGQAASTAGRTGPQIIHVNPDTAEKDLSHDITYGTDGETTAAEEDDGHDEHGKPKKKHRFLNLLKGGAKTGVTAVLGADRVKAQLGSEHSKQRQGVLRRRQYIDGPSMYKCRYDGKRGWLIIVSGSKETLNGSQY